jgi:hypothetical protein
VTFLSSSTLRFSYDPSNRILYVADRLNGREVEFRENDSPFKLRVRLMRCIALCYDLLQLAGSSFGGVPLCGENCRDVHQRSLRD